MPLLLQPVLAPLAGHGEAVELAGEADGEVADVDHLLDLAQALPQGLAHLQGHQPGQGLLVPAQLVAEGLHHLAPLGGRHQPPAQPGLVAAGEDGLELLRGDVHDRAQGLPVHGGDHRLRLAAAQPLPGEAAGVLEAIQESGVKMSKGIGHGIRSVFDCIHRLVVMKRLDIFIV